MTEETFPAEPSEIASAQLEDLTHLFRVLSDPVRLRILLLVTERERNVTSLCTATGLAQPTVSHHLGLLRLASLAEGRRSGKSIYYSAGERIVVEGPSSIRFRAGDSTVAQVKVRLGAPSPSAPPSPTQPPPLEPACT